MNQADRSKRREANGLRLSVRVAMMQVGIMVL